MPASGLLRLLRRRTAPKVFVIGLDCAEPSLVFDRFRPDLPNLTRLVGEGRSGPLESTIPPITVPAWSSMFSARDPGELGFYGFRNRADHTYSGMQIATGASVTEPRVWDIAGDAGKKVVVVGVPQTFPAKPVNGSLVSGFLTPSTRANYTYPGSLAAEIEQVLKSGQRGDYELDVSDFRTEDKSQLLRQIQRMTEKRCQLVHHFLRSKPWDLFMFVEIGVDRMHHGFWRYGDPRHPKHELGNPYETAIRDYYAYLDGQIGLMLEALPEDTTVMVLSDHGAKPMIGGFCFNQWLIDKGYLVLEDEPDGILPLSQCRIDWRRTRAWGSGGYYGRLFLNVAGREEQGVIPADQYEAVRAQLAEELEACVGPDGQPLGNKVFRPQDVYSRVRNIPPDLIVYFGDLYWRSVGTVGYDSLYVFENDTGPDDANHAQDGLYIVREPALRGVSSTVGDGSGACTDRRRTWRAVTPSILEGLGLEPADWMSRCRL